MNTLIFKRERPILVQPAVKMEQKHGSAGVVMEILLLYAGLLGYAFCNTTALKAQIPPLAVVLITLLSFGLMLALAWYRRVFYGVLGGVAALGAIAFPITARLLGALGNSLEICYNYIVWLLGSQENYSNYLNFMTMDLSGILDNRALLTRHIYTALVLVTLIASALFALALYRRIPIIVAFLVPFLGLVPFFYYGVVPGYVAFSVFLSALIGCYGQSVVQRMTRRRDRKIKRRAKAARAQSAKRPNKRRARQSAEERLAFAATNGSFGVIIAGVMLAVTLATAALIYTRPILQLNAVRSALDRFATETMNTIFRTTYEKQLHVAGYMEPGEELSLMPPNWRNLKVAEVDTKTGNPVYLRYRTTVDLTENGWTVDDLRIEEDYQNAVDSGFCEYTQYYNFLKLTSKSGDPLNAGLDNVDSEEQGYLSDQVTVYPHYRVSNLLGLPGGAVAQAPVSDYDDLERANDTILWHNDNPKDLSYMYRVTAPVLTSNVYLTNFNAALQGYIGIRNRHGDNDPYMSQEASYSSFVMRHYTTIPDELHDSLDGLGYKITSPYKTKLEKVQAVERYLRTEYTYSTVRQRLERLDENGKRTQANAGDYITWFLFQNEKKEGYCTLFASSMVAILRDMSIPARVVTGYYCEPKLYDNENYAAMLYDRDFHAWVEVYFDGMGWIAFEPTPDRGAERNYYLLELVDEHKESEYEVTVEIVYVEDPNYVRYSKELPDPTGLEERNDIRQQIATVLNVRSMSGLVRILLRIVLILLLLMSVFVAGAVLHRHALRAAAKSPPSEGTRKAYYMILRLMQLQSFRFFEGELLEEFATRADNLQLAPVPMQPVVPVLQKSLYADLPVTEEERAAALEYLYALDKAVFRRANPFKALWYKFTLLLKPRHKKLIWSFR